MESFLNFTFLTCLLVSAATLSQGREFYHSSASNSPRNTLTNEAEQDPEFWYSEAAAGILARERRGAGGASDGGAARNVVMFLGDGMSVPTLAAARTLLGQRAGQPGEEAQLSFESFPTIGLAKTYCVDAQVADSACTATAYLCGAKANYGTLGVSGAVPRRHCAAAAERRHRLDSIAAWALRDGRDAGIVTTTRVTHASPAGAYAGSADRDWESDAALRAACPTHTDVQDDIALQLVHSFPGNKFKVILGGGRREFLPNTTVDEEGGRGRRTDGRDLIQEWQDDKRNLNASYLYAWNREQLLELEPSSPPEYLLGLFEADHMQYRAEANPDTEPSLAELTELAVRSLRRNTKGFFLFVEGGRIDHAHHENMARLALDETIELSAAVSRAAELLDEEDSLLVVTADHSHVMAFNGYTHRGGDILGVSDDVGDDGVPYMTLSYTNGPGFRPHVADGVRDDVTRYDYEEARFAFPASVPLESETHGGDDIAVFARGPQHGMFSGLYEQSQLPHLMGYASCLGPGRHSPACSAARRHRPDTDNN